MQRVVAIAMQSYQMATAIIGKTLLALQQGVMPKWPPQFLFT